MREEWSLIILILDQKFWSLLCYVLQILERKIFYFPPALSLYYVELNFYLFSIANTYIRKPTLLTVENWILSNNSANII